MTKINVPAYITGSDFGSIHTMGSIRGYIQIDSPHKWIRWAAWQEWHDLWSVPETSKHTFLLFYIVAILSAFVDVELMAFFDKFLKGIDNDWEKTPRVRWTTLQFGDNEPIQNIELDDFPPPQTDYRTLYLTSQGGLSAEKPSDISQIAYESNEKNSRAAFVYTFPEDTRLLGLPKAHLYMSCPDGEDWSICVELQKLDSEGKQMRNCNIPFSRTPHKSMKEVPDSFKNGLLVFDGSTGLLRASRRHIDPSKSMHPNYPFHPHDRTELVPKGNIVELEVGIWAIGVDYKKGESLRVVVNASNPTWPELEEEGLVTSEKGINVGKHIVHIGPDYPSRVVLPVLPV
jgi:hypothetical protein